MQSEPLQAEITGIRGVIDHPHLPNTILAIQERRIYSINETNCLTLATRGTSSECQDDLETIKNVDVDKWTGIVHIQMHTTDLIALIDEDHYCVMLYNMRARTLNTGGWIGKCGTKGTFYGSFHETRLKKAELPVYDQHTATLYLMVDHREVVGCDIAKELCTEVAETSVKDHFYFISLDSYAFIFIEQHCNSYVYRHSDGEQFDSYSLNGNFDCTPNNFVGFGDDLFIFGNLLAKIDVDHDALTLTTSPAGVISEANGSPFPPPHPDTHVDSVTQSGPWALYYTTQQNTFTKFYRIYAQFPDTTTTLYKSTTTETAITHGLQNTHRRVAQYYRSFPVEMDACTNGVVLSQLTSTNIANCAYACLRTASCSCIQYMFSQLKCELVSCTYVQSGVQPSLNQHSRCLVLKQQ